MSRELWIAAALIVVAIVGVAVVANLPDFQKNQEAKKIVAPESEPVALLPKKDETIKPTPRTPPEEPIAPIRPQDKSPIDPKSEVPAKKIDEPKTGDKADPEPKGIAKIDTDPKKNDPVVDPKKEIAKVEPKKDKTPEPTKPDRLVQVGENLAKLNDPDGEFAVKTIYGAKHVQFIGQIKTLRITDINERSTLDLSQLVADEVIFNGNINSGSKVILGQAKTLHLRDVNQSIVDASALGARQIVVAGSVNAGSTIKLHAPKGTIEFLGEINDRSQVEISAAEGKVVFKGRGNSVVNGGVKLLITARELEFTGAINGPNTEVDVTLTRGAAMNVWRISSGVRFHYRKADPSDPEPRIDAGPTAGADFRMVATPKK